MTVRSGDMAETQPPRRCSDQRCSATQSRTNSSALGQPDLAHPGHDHLERRQVVGDRDRHDPPARVGPVVLGTLVEHRVAVPGRHHGAHRLVAPRAVAHLRVDPGGLEQRGEVRRRVRQVEQHQRVLGEVGQPHGLAAREPVARSHQHVRRRLRHRGRDEVVVEVVAVHQADLALPRVQRPLQGGVLALQHGDVHVRVPLAVRRDEGGQPEGGERLEAPQAQLAAQRLAGVDRGLGELLAVLEEPAQLGVELATGGREVQAARVVAQQQLHPELLLQLRDRRGDRGLRDHQLAGRRGHAAVLGGCGEVAQLHEGERRWLHRADPAPATTSRARPRPTSRSTRPATRASADAGDTDAL
jgi:hypothetical protein